MRTLIVSLVALIALGATAATVWAAPPESRNFNTHLSGEQEVPERDTPAQGQANFQLSRDASELSYKVIVANIENVFAAHIHCGASGENGPVGATLFSGGSADGRTQGILARGVLTEPDPGNGCGWESLQEMVDAMRSGDAYVNVHTNDGVPPADSGPGDFPGGEIRGQIRENGAS